jgi:hypothetical protein
MSETGAVVGIYGAIDRKVQTDPVARAQVAELISQYQTKELSWYDDFNKWLGEGEAAAPAFPGLAEALDELAQLPAGTNRIRARRMFAIAAASRAFRELADEHNPLRHAAVAALHSESLDGEGGGLASAEGLYRLLSGAAGAGPHLVNEEAVPIPPGEWWGELVQQAVTDHLLPGPEGMFPRPCSGKLVTVPGISGPVAALTTVHETNELTFEQATRLIEPENWVTCMPNFWCQVQALSREPPLGRRTYHEVVSTHCGEAGPGFAAETDLLFNFMWLPSKDNAQAALCNYQLAGWRPAPGDRIVVDEGTILVATTPGSDVLKVMTTKRIKFSYPFVSEALALIMCALGYADIAGGLLSCAAAQGINAIEEFPGVPLPAGAVKPAAQMAGAGPPPGPGGGGGLLKDTMDIWARALREGAAALERGSGIGGSGKGS